MSPAREQRIVIAGASSLLGSELKSLLEESRFASWDFSLLDEDTTAGTLTEAAGEATVIQRVEEGSFEHARLVFFAGSAAFTQRNIAAARDSGATVIDLSGALVANSGISAWFPQVGVLREGEVPNTKSFVVPSAAGTAASMLCLALSTIGLKHLAFTAFQPVSAAGRIGIDELESQTSQLLSFQSVGKPVFDAQVAFALLDSFGPGSSHNLLSNREQIRSEVELCIAGKVGLPAIELIHVPVFYGLTFGAWAQFEPETNHPKIVSACEGAGFSIARGEDAVSNISAAGESLIQLASPHADPAGFWWFWGAADNIRLPAANAIKLADTLDQ